MKYNVKEYILNFFFPKKCIFCGRMLPLWYENRVCVKCTNTLPFCMKYNRCKMCGKPILDQEELCDDCRGKKYYYDKISAVFEYEGNVRKSILRFKKDDGRVNGLVFAKYIALVVMEDNQDKKFDMVISVAPRRQRLKKDKYDQAEWLGRLVARELKLTFVKKVLKQKEKRKKQSDLRAEERIVNIKGNYVVKKPKKVKGKTILLIDDVTTTGATLNESAKMLKRAGAKSICCGVVATVIK